MWYNPYHIIKVCLTLQYFCKSNRFWLIHLMYVPYCCFIGSSKNCMVERGTREVILNDTAWFGDYKTTVHLKSNTNGMCSITGIEFRYRYIFAFILQNYFTGIGAIVRLPQCQWRNPEWNGYIDPIDSLRSCNEYTRWAQQFRDHIMWYDIYS